MAAWSSNTKKKQQLLLWVATLLMLLLTTAVTNGQATTTAAPTAEEIGINNEIDDLTTEVQIGNNSTLVFQGDKDEEEIVEAEVGANDTTATTTTTPTPTPLEVEDGNPSWTLTDGNKVDTIQFGNVTVELDEAVHPDDVDPIPSGLVAGGFAVETDNGATMLFEEENEDGETSVANWTYVIMPSSEVGTAPYSGNYVPHCVWLWVWVTSCNGREKLTWPFFFPCLSLIFLCGECHSVWRKHPFVFL